MSYEKTTEGIRISVRPDFSVLHSDPGQSRFVFTYSVQMENQGEESVQLLFRHWLIHDSDGEDSEVDGEGGVGELPTLDPGYSPHYQSFSWGRVGWGQWEYFWLLELIPRSIKD